MQIYDFTVQSIDGRPVPLAEFCGKVLLIVNTASMKLYQKEINALIERLEKELERNA